MIQYFSGKKKLAAFDCPESRVAKESHLMTASKLKKRIWRPRRFLFWQLTFCSDFVFPTKILASVWHHKPQTPSIFQLLESELPGLLFLKWYFIHRVLSQTRPQKLSQMSAIYCDIVNWVLHYFAEAPIMSSGQNWALNWGWFPIDGSIFGESVANMTNAFHRICKQWKTTSLVAQIDNKNTF